MSMASLFGSPAVPAAPTPIPPPTMPDPNDPATMAAAQKARAQVFAGGGRAASTLTTMGGPTLGPARGASPAGAGAAPTYASRTLGAGG